MQNQLDAAKAVNQQMLALYYGVGYLHLREGLRSNERQGVYHAQPMGAAGNGRATRQRGVQEIVQARGVVTIPTNLRTYKLTNLQTYIKSSRIPLRARQSQTSRKNQLANASST